jgi:hypothetical protein
VALSLQYGPTTLALAFLLPLRIIKYCIPALYCLLYPLFPHRVLSIGIFHSMQAEWDTSVDTLHSALSFLPPPEYRFCPGPPSSICKSLPTSLCDANAMLFIAPASPSRLAVASLVALNAALHSHNRLFRSPSQRQQHGDA